MQPQDLQRRRLLALAAGAGLAACSKQEGEGAQKTAASAPAQAASDPQQAYQLAATGTGIAVGQTLSAYPVRVFFDPQCPHCATLWFSAKALWPRARFEWMPVGVLGAASLPLAAALLSDPDPAAAMDRHEAQIHANTRPEPPAKVDAAARAKVEANNALFEKLGGDSVPTFFFRHASLGQYGRHAGAMETEDLRQLLGV
jgi:thiol:disulfide interchange protein DsbG